MDGKLVFCADGVLRMQSPYSEHMLSLIDIQHALDLSPSEMFLDSLRRDVLVEEGSTIGTFLMCIEPWAHEAASLTDRQVKAYITEMRRPSSAEPAFDKVEVRFCASISRSPKLEEMPEGVDFLEWLNRPNKKIEFLNTFEFGRGYDICGYTNGDPSNYSMSSTSIHELKNVPLVINRDAVLVESCYNAKRTDKGSVMRAESEGVHQLGHNRLVIRLDDVSLSFQDLLETVICDGLWYDSPNGAIRQRELLSDAMAELKDAIDNSDGRQDAAGSDQDSDDSDITTTECTVKTVTIREGAFDGIVRHHEVEGAEWAALTAALAKSKTANPIRIGGVTEHRPTDNRLLGQFVEIPNE